jgi:hypothetical protein
MTKRTKPEELGVSSERLMRINDFMKRYVDGGKSAGFGCTSGGNYLPR